MLETALSEQKTIEKLKTASNRPYGRKDDRLGKCLICGERVRTAQSYITTREGYTHRKCLKKWLKNRGRGEK